MRPVVGQGAGPKREKSCPHNEVGNKEIGTRMPNLKKFFLPFIAMRALFRQVKLRNQNQTLQKKNKDDVSVYFFF